MKKKFFYYAFLVATVLFIFSSNVFAGEFIQAKFKTVTAGKPLRFAFTVKNCGSKDLIIQDRLRVSDSYYIIPIHLTNGKRQKLKSITIKPKETKTIYFTDYYRAEENRLEEILTSTAQRYVFNVKYSKTMYQINVRRKISYSGAKITVTQTTKYQKGAFKINAPKEFATYAKYKRIKTGMTLAQVRKIMEFNGKRTSSSDDTSTYRFDGVDEYTGAWLTFYKGKVVHKYQDGL